ncbi:MAG: electron transport complex subunit RsxC [Gammaproteobacteria bacterium]|nr:electron transport complex subunit RsxC [Gammaproteobacteria bacterium]
MSGNRTLWRFHGGLHLEGHKALSTGQPIRTAATPPQLVLPLQQHIGLPAKPLVAVGERVLKGQLLAHPEGHVSAAIHASSSGTVVAIEERAVPHPSGLTAPCIVIDTDGTDEWCALTPHPDYKLLDHGELRNLIRDAGIVGLGGAGFPSFIKLNPGGRTAIETLILNGAECEPYISCDDMLMRERPQEVVKGARIMRHALQARYCLIGIEDNKPEAAAALRRALDEMGEREIEVVLVPTRYPTGGERQLIKVLTGKEVPSQGLPLDVGVVCHNVTTAAAVHRAVERGEPLISRIVTITGQGARQPQNIETRIGTPIDWLLEQAGGTQGRYRLLMGGPMMGFALHDTRLPTIKTSNCLLLASEAELPPPAPAMPCIRCGECARVCPAQLLPQQLYWHSRAKEFDKVQDYSLFDCIECGCCAYVCPSRLPLVQFYRYAKTEIWSQERERQAADLARERHAFREFRKEREKAEKAARHKAKAQAVQQDGNEETKKAAIQAAMERAKAKRENAEVAPKNTDNLTPEQQRKVDEIEARRADTRAAEGDRQPAVEGANHARPGTEDT